MTDIGKVIACFKELEFHFHLENFEDRLIAQKIVCLLQLKGVELGYPSGLYIRGPYSPVLTQDLYENGKDISCYKTEVSLSEQEKGSVNELKNIFGLSSSLLEIGATYGFQNQILHQDHFDSFKELKKMKPFYSDAMLALGASKAKQFFGKVSDDNMKEMKVEFEAWQNASFY